MTSHVIDMTRHPQEKKKIERKKTLWNVIYSRWGVSSSCALWYDRAASVTGDVGLAIKVHHSYSSCIVSFYIRESSPESFRKCVLIHFSFTNILVCIRLNKRKGNLIKKERKWLRNPNTERVDCGFPACEDIELNRSSVDGPKWMVVICFFLSLFFFAGNSR